MNVLNGPDAYQFCANCSTNGAVLSWDPTTASNLWRCQNCAAAWPSSYWSDPLPGASDFNSSAANYGYFGDPNITGNLQITTDHSQTDLSAGNVPINPPRSVSFPSAATTSFPNYHHVELRPEPFNETIPSRRSVSETPQSHAPARQLSFSTDFSDGVSSSLELSPVITRSDTLSPSFSATYDSEGGMVYPALLPRPALESQTRLSPVYPNSPRPNSDAGPSNALSLPTNLSSEYTDSTGYLSTTPTSAQGQQEEEEDEDPPNSQPPSRVPSRMRSSRRFEKPDKLWKFGFHRKYGVCEDCRVRKRRCLPKHLPKELLRQVPQDVWDKCPRRAWIPDLD